MSLARRLVACRVVVCLVRDASTRTGEYASHAASFVPGHLLVVDGGFLASGMNH
jgi:hypothetical protein